MQTLNNLATIWFQSQILILTFQYTWPINLQSFYLFGGMQINMKQTHAYKPLGILTYKLAKLLFVWRNADQHEADTRIQAFGRYKR